MTVVDAPESEFRRLVNRFRAGDPEAQARLLADYGGVVRAAVRRRLPDRLRKEYDSIDFAQDVWASFCTLPPERARFDTPDALGGFLASVAQNKVIDVCRRRYGTAAHDVTRERPYFAADRPLAARGATPSQCAIADERLTALAARLPAAHVRVVNLLRAGHTQAEIAGLVGISERQVRRVVDRVRELCEDDT